MATDFPGSADNFPDTTGAEVLGTAGSGIGLSALLNNHSDAVEAVETKIGTGSSAPSSGKVLRATGAGASAWAAVDLTADVTGTLPVNKGGTGAATHTSGNYLKGAGTSAVTSSTPAAVAAEVGALLFPVGAIYIAVVSTNPNTLLGFGTWSAFGTGRTLVGIDSGQTEFDTVEETGGEKTHTLTIPEMPSHTHDVGARDTDDAGTTGAVRGTNAGVSFPTGPTGGGGAHNNLQPYIVVYMWKRTA